MKVNILLTGDINVGKSYILNKFLKTGEYNTSGFKTLPKYDGERLEGYIISNLLGGNQSDKNIFVGKNTELDGKKKCVGIRESFDTFGVEILDDALMSDSKYILMDELGFFEKDSYFFQEKVNQVFDSDKVVIGVIKKRDNPFLNKIRERSDVEIIEITLENREEMYKLFAEKMEEVK